MNALEVVGNYIAEEEIYGLQLKTHEEETTGREIMNIRTEQIRTGEGVFTDPRKLMNAELADRLNETPNPERNGLVLYLANELLEVVGRDDSKYLTVLRFLYKGGTGTKLSLPKPKPEGSEGFGAFSPREYQLLQKFISETLISGIMAFKAKHSSQDTIDFRNFALNMNVALFDIKRAF